MPVDEMGERDQLARQGLRPEVIDALLGSYRDGHVYYVKRAPGITVGGVKLSDRPLLLLIDEET